MKHEVFIQVKNLKALASKLLILRQEGIFSMQSWDDARHQMFSIADAIEKAIEDMDDCRPAGISWSWPEFGVADEDMPRHDGR